MMAGGRITGRVVTDTGAPLPSEAQRMMISASAVSANLGGGGGPGRVNPDGTFEIRGLVDPRIIRANPPSGWAVKSIVVNGQDVIDGSVNVDPGQTLGGMEIVLTNRVSSVTGMVVDARGQPVLDASIVVFPDDPRLWQFGARHIRTARPDQEGRYRIEPLPPSDRYLAIAVQDIEDGQSSDPAYLTAVRASATPFSLREGDSKVVDLKLQP